MSEPTTSTFSVVDFVQETKIELSRPELPLRERLETVLITGATGFLGRYLLLNFVNRPELARTVTCLVRAANDAQAESKLLKALQATGWTGAALPSNVHVVRGEVTQSGFGLPEQVWTELARNTDAVIHCAAEVTWVKTYEQLAPSNVQSTRNVAQFCSSGRAKRLVFVSSIAVAYVPSRQDPVDEHTELLPLAAHMPMGYAQSKIVAETIATQLLPLGCPVSVMRPGLICGDSRTGVLNLDDFLARMLISHVRDKEAPDAPWLIDCVPVDCVAQAVIAALDHALASRQTVHLVHPTPMSLRELVVAINMCSPGVRLMPWDDWVRSIAHRTRSRAHPLTPLRGFLMKRSDIDRNVRVPEYYWALYQRRISMADSLRWLAQRDLELSSLDGALLERSLEFLARRRLIAPITAVSPHDAGARTRARHIELVRQGLSAGAGSDHAWQSQATVSAPQDEGFVSKVSAWLYAEQGVNRIVRLSECGATGQQLGAFVKTGPRQRAVELLGQALGTTLGAQFDGLLGRFMALLDFDDPGQRELLAYQQLRPQGVCAPMLYAAHQGDPIVMALELLDDARLIPESQWTTPWSAERMRQALNTILSWQRLGVHASSVAPRIQGPGLAKFQHAAPLWTALADHTAQFLRSKVGEDAARHMQHIARRSDWHFYNLTRCLNTVIHNDFNPRNVALPARGDARMLAFDWQLVTRGAALRDLVELCTFVAPSDQAWSFLQTWAMHHAEQLDVGFGGDSDWLGQLPVVLDDWALRRLSLYVLFDRITPQDFIGTIARKWWAMREASLLQSGREQPVVSAVSTIPVS